MKTLKNITIALVTVLACAAFAAEAGTVRGYTRSNGTYVAPHYRSDSGSLGGSHSAGYVYRNPYAATPSVDVNGYSRSSGTYVAPHVRTVPNDTLSDNLSYRGFGTIRVPKSSLGSGYILPPPSFSAPRTLPAFGGDLGVRPLGKSSRGF